MRNLFTPAIESYVQDLEKRGCKLRYSGGFVPDINQVLIKGSGVFMYPHLNGHPNGKLRLSFELNPMAFLVEQAGGAASDGHGPILDRIPQGKSDRAPVFIGCKEDVALAEEYIASMGE